MAAPIWNLINPSDKYTFQTDDFEALAFGVMVISNGSYAVEELDVDEPRSSTIFAFGGDPKEWWQETFGHSIDDFKPWQKRVADALDTLVAGNRDDYESAVAAISDDANRAAFIAGWNDRKRSSMNDIGKVIRAWVAKLRKADKAA